MTDAERMAIAKHAAPGPWRMGSEYEQQDPGYYVSAANGLIVVADGESCYPTYRDAMHIAANSPDQIIALLERIAACESALRMFLREYHGSRYWNHVAAYTRTALALANDHFDAPK